MLDANSESSDRTTTAEITCNGRIPMSSGKEGHQPRAASGPHPHSCEVSLDTESEQPAEIVCVGDRVCSPSTTPEPFLEGDPVCGRVTGPDRHVVSRYLSVNCYRDL